MWNLSLGSKPLQLWDKKVRNGHIKRITDEEIQSLVVEVVGTNVRYADSYFIIEKIRLYCLFSTAYITCPLDPKKTLGIKLPYFVMVVKNMNKYFSFEVQVCALSIILRVQVSHFSVFSGSR